MSDPFAPKGTLTTQAADREVADLPEHALNRLAARADEATKSWLLLDDDQRLALRAREALARRRLEAQRQSEQAATDAKRQGERDARAAAEVEQFRQQARGVFPGSAQEFESAFPDLLRRWQADQTLERLSADLIAQKRARGGYDL